MKKEYFLTGPALSIAELASLCTRAIENNIEQMAVPPILVKKTAELLTNTSIRVGSLVGYPYGWPAVEAKLADTILSMVDGASDIDLFINITALKNNDWQYLAKELNTINTVVKKQQCLLNIIIDPVWLTDEEMQQCCDLYGIAGINYFTLMSENGQHIDPQIELIRKHLADVIAIRAVNLADFRETGVFSSYGKIVK
jgi:deoxyribose-phosphate aldolase